MKTENERLLKKTGPVPVGVLVFNGLGPRSALSHDKCSTITAVESQIQPLAEPGRKLSRPEAARRTARGFTLLELLVVVVIIGLLAAYVGPKYFSQVGKSEQAIAKSQIEAFSRALGTYRLDVGAFPTTEEGLSALVLKPEGAAKWNGPYLDRAVPNDPWGRAYAYRSPGTHGDFDIVSLGKDGQAGGTGDAADINNF
jgi:general secretion pathway protein G